LFPGRKFPGHSLLFLFFEKKWGIVLGHPKEDPRGAREGLCLFKAEHVFVV